MAFRFASWHWLLVGALPWLQARAAHAQAVQHGYEFMTVTTTQTGGTKTSFIRFFPAFQEKTAIQLETVSGLSIISSQDNFRKNTELINQQLGLITTQGWELVQVLPSSMLTEVDYLFRKPRP